MSDDHGHLLALLARHDAPCPRCGYNLRGAQSASCPECGTPIQFTALLQGRRKAGLAWSLTLIALAAALPVSAQLWQRLIIRRKFYYGDLSYMHGGSGEIDFASFTALDWLTFLGSHAYWLAIPLAVVGCLTLRQRMERWPTWLRWCVAVIALTLLMLAYRRWQFWWYWTPWSDRYAPWPMWWLAQ